ncbi:MAG: hypothetical protein ACOC38_02355 [Promethearchaeia archaeon]
MALDAKNRDHMGRLPLMNIKSIYIIKRETGVCMYHKDFQEAIFDPDLISSFLSAMTSFLDQATGTVKSRARAFEGTDHRIIIEFGDWILGALSVEQESAQLREKLKRTVKKFEEQFNLLRWVDIDLAVYSRFEKVVLDEFVRDRIQEDSIIQVKHNWELFTGQAEVRSFLNLIPKRCSVQDAADFLEIPLDLVVDLASKAYWDKAIEVSSPVTLDDIYQTTFLNQNDKQIQGVSEKTIKALGELDGETPLVIAAERVKTKDMKRFLEEIALLAEKHAVEPVPEVQSILVLYKNVLQTAVLSCAKLIGHKAAATTFRKSQKALLEVYPWVRLVCLENQVDVEIKNQLNSAVVRRAISAETISKGFGKLMRYIAEGTSYYTGCYIANRIVQNTRNETRRQFPHLVNSISWDKLTVTS